MAPRKATAAQPTTAAEPATQSASAESPASSAVVSPEVPVPNIRFHEKTYMEDVGLWDCRIQLAMGPGGDYLGPQAIPAPPNATEEELAEKVARDWGLGSLTVIAAE